ncbi:MAG: hypothetical protein Fur0046_24510 [Cyanobacteria bacterium J069]|nr:MAG: hypothetical protein D6742_17700 [Cyanobacteria bacterium J069]
MDDLLQWWAVGLALVALLAIASGSRSAQRGRIWQAAGDRPAQHDWVAVEPSCESTGRPDWCAISQPETQPETPPEPLRETPEPKTPQSAIALTYRGVSYLRWR